MRKVAPVNIDDVPFNRLIGLQREPAGREFAVSLPADERYYNHLGIVHAAAQLAVAEAASGDWLLRNFGEHAVEFIAVVRRMETTFKQPARGKIFGKAVVGAAVRAQLAADLATKRTWFLTLGVEVFDEAGAHTLTGSVEWFLTRRPVAGA